MSLNQMCFPPQVHPSRLGTYDGITQHPHETMFVKVRCCRLGRIATDALHELMQARQLRQHWIMWHTLSSKTNLLSWK